MVNFMFQFDEALGANIFAQTLFGVYLLRCFWMRWTFKLVDWVMWIAPHPQSVWALFNQLKTWTEQKGWLSPKKERIPFDCLSAFELEHGLFPAFRLELKHQLFLCGEPAGLWASIILRVLLVLSSLDLNWSYTISICGSLACWVKILGLVSLHNCKNT